MDGGGTRDQEYTEGKRETYPLLSDNGFASAHSWDLDQYLLKHIGREGGEVTLSFPKAMERSTVF